MDGSQVDGAGPGGLAVSRTQSTAGGDSSSTTTTSSTSTAQSIVTHAGVKRGRDWDNKESKQGSSDLGDVDVASFLQEWPFDTDYRDHFETPFRAYEHVAPVLALARKLAGKPNKTVKKNKKEPKKQDKDAEEEEDPLVGTLYFGGLRANMQAPHAGTMQTCTIPFCLSLFVFNAKHNRWCTTHTIARAKSRPCFNGLGILTWSTASETSMLTSPTAGCQV